MPEEALLLEECSDMSSEDFALLTKALELAKRAHHGQIRQASKQPYLIHPIEVALVLHKKFGDPSLTIAGLLHDTVEDCEDISMKMIYEMFGGDIGFMVDAATKTSLSYYGDSVEFKDKVEKMLYGGVKDIRCLLVKLTDRENNLMTLSSLKYNKQVRISFETQAIYSPLKRIIHFNDKSLTIEKAKEGLADFMKEKNLVYHEDLGKFLYHFTFEDFSREIFDEVYTCSENVVWEVQDLDRFESLCLNKEFQDSTKLISLTTDGFAFSARFCFIGAHVMQESNEMKMNVSNFMT